VLHCHLRSPVVLGFNQEASYADPGCTGVPNFIKMAELLMIQQVFLIHFRVAFTPTHLRVASAELVKSVEYMM